MEEETGLKEMAIHRRVFYGIVALEGVVVLVLILFFMRDFQVLEKAIIISVYLGFVVAETFVLRRRELELLINLNPHRAEKRVTRLLKRSRMTFTLIVVLLILGPIFVVLPIGPPTMTEETLSGFTSKSLAFRVISLPEVPLEFRLQIESDEPIDIYVVDADSDLEFSISNIPGEFDPIRPQSIRPLTNITVKEDEETWSISSNIVSEGKLSYYIMPTEAYDHFIANRNRSVTDAIGDEIMESEALLRNCTHTWRDRKGLFEKIQMARGEYQVVMYNKGLEPVPASLGIYKIPEGDMIISRIGVTDDTIDEDLGPGNYKVFVVSLHEKNINMKFRITIKYLEYLGWFFIFIGVISLISYSFLFVYLKVVSEGLKEHLLGVHDTELRMGLDDRPGRVSKTPRKAKEVGIKTVDKDTFLSMLSEEVTRLKDMGNETFRMNDFEGALELYDRALDIEPSNPGIWNNRALALRALGRYEEALNGYEKALSYDPGNKKFLAGKKACLTALTKASGYERIREVATAKPLLMRRESPEHAKKEGDKLFMQGRYLDAIERFKEAVKLRPDYTSAWNNMGLSYRQLFDYESALKCYQDALKYDPDNEKAIEGLKACKEKR